MIRGTYRYFFRKNFETENEGVSKEESQMSFEDVQTNDIVTRPRNYETIIYKMFTAKFFLFIIINT